MKSLSLVIFLFGIAASNAGLLHAGVVSGIGSPAVISGPSGTVVRSGLGHGGIVSGLGGIGHLGVGGILGHGGIIGGIPALGGIVGHGGIIAPGLVGGLYAHPGSGLEGQYVPDHNELLYDDGSYKPHIYGH